MPAWAVRSDLAERQQVMVDELLSVLRVEADGDGWVGHTPDWYGPVLFGGLGLAMTISAACRDAPDGSRLHSIHGHFLRPVLAGRPIMFRSEIVKAGRSICVLRVTASLDGKPAIVLTCSFTTDTEGYVYDLSGIPHDVPLPEALPEPDDADAEEWLGPFDAHWLGTSAPRADGTFEATHRHWFRLARSVGDEPHLHAALLGYATDWTGLGGRPHHLEGDITGMVSLDHAAWFHRPARIDEWLLQDVQCVVNAGGRGALARRHPQHQRRDRRVDGPGDAVATNRRLTQLSGSVTALRVERAPVAQLVDLDAPHGGAPLAAVRRASRRARRSASHARCRAAPRARRRRSLVRRVRVARHPSTRVRHPGPTVPDRRRARRSPHCHCSRRRERRTA